MAGFLSIQERRRIALLFLFFFLVQCPLFQVEAAGKDDLQITIDMKKTVVPEEKGTVVITFKNLGKYKLASIYVHINSPLLKLDENDSELELDVGKEETIKIGFSVKADRLGKSFIAVTANFCTLIPQAIPPCPAYNKNVRMEFTVTDAPPETSPPPVVEKKISVVIVSPSANSSFSPEQEIEFVAQSSNPEKQMFYVWESDIDGLLGNNERFSKRLSEGTHTITLSVKSGTQNADATVQIVVSKAEVEESESPPPVSTDVPSEGTASRIKTIATFIAVCAILAVVAIGIVSRLPKKGGRKRKMGHYHSLKICPSCQRNNSANASRCWKCKAPLR